jgi:hypothetical protein
MSVLDEHAEQILLSPTEALAAVRAWEQQGALLSLALRHVEATNAYAVDGTVSMNAWLRNHAKMNSRAASALLSVGRFLDTNLAFAEAAITGTLSAGQITVAKQLAHPKYASLLGELGAELAEILAPLSFNDTQVAVTAWRKDADALLDDGEPPVEAPNELCLARTLDGRLHGTLSLEDAAATELEKAIQNAQTWEGKDDPRSTAERQGDALFDIAAFYNKNHDGDGTPRHLPDITLSAEASSIATDAPEATNDDTGRPVSPACTKAYLCDCKLHVILRDANGAPEQFGRAQYTVPRNLFRQIAARDGGCRFPGCDRPVRWTDAHHIHHWRHGGTTDYDNLLLLCRRHHVYVHQQQLEVKLRPDAVAEFTWRDGTHRTTTPRGAPPTRRPQPPV